ncbi:RHS repeat-associated core domain-containing protein [Salibacter halophilus]|uniref:RHS repeat-associated core domain-containing protein n=1 Tax=Salibacter halophilus TaxID=1803916 RepID=A0A6N6M186_9FLAO|nr:RHS repeat-associated core domain-containing protein [Salibacter halophilus]KAB1061956.1 hypothetical protein F3059_12825 [Salibacter halophilus]
MMQPGRVYNSPEYRYGFQGQEKDDEIKGSGNSINYKYRVHDPRLGRFMSIDPLSPKYPQWSPYVFSGNRVVDAFELEGLEPVDAKKGAKHLVVVVQGFWGEPGKNKTLVSNTPMAVDNTGLGSVEQGFGGKSQIQVATYNSSRKSGTIADVGQTIDNFMSANPDGEIIMVGHSLGADNVMDIANETEHEIDLIITLDIADYWDSDNAPSNVNNVVNIYQTNDFPGGEDVEGNGNTNVQNFNAKKSTHRSIDQDFAGTILQIIENQVHVKPSSTSAGNAASHEDVDKDE